MIKTTQHEQHTFCRDISKPSLPCDNKKAPNLTFLWRTWTLNSGFLFSFLEDKDVTVSKRVVSIQVYSFEVLIVPRTRSKEPKILTQNVFLVLSQTILEVNKILVQFHCLSLYPRNDLYRNDFVSKRYIMIFSPRTVAFPVASSLPKKFSAKHL